MSKKIVLPDILQGIRFESVQGDVMRRLSPDSNLNLNSVGAWLVSGKVPGHRAKKIAEALNAFLDKYDDGLKY